MFLVKFTDPEWKQTAISGKSVRIGSVLYYREINDPTFRDEDEGEGSIAYKSKVPLDAETYNRIFSGEGYQLSDGWTIDTGGVPLISQKSIFNPYIYSCSLVRRKKNIPAIEKKFKKNAHYYINDVWKFVDNVSEGLRKHILFSVKNNPNIANPEVQRKIDQLEILPVIGKVIYSNDKKERVVDETNATSFNPNTFDLKPYFRKPTLYSDECEFRMIWLPNLGDMGKDTFEFMTTTDRTINLSLNNHGLSSKPKSIKQILNKKGNKIA